MGGKKKAVFFFLKTEFYFIQGKEKALKKQKITEEQTNKKNQKHKGKGKQKSISTEIFPKRIFLQKRKTEQASLGSHLTASSPGDPLSREKGSASFLFVWFGLLFVCLLGFLLSSRSYFVVAPT